MPAAAATVRSFAFDGVVRLTRIGTSYVIFTIVIGFAALNTGNNALYIALVFLLGCLLLSGVASKGGLKHLRVEFAAVDQPWAGRAAHGLLRLHNSSHFWNVRDVVITAPELARPVLVPVVMKRSTTEAAAELMFPRRGVVTLTRLDFYTRYPFGFFLKKRRIAIQGELIVFPKLLEAADRRDRYDAADDGLVATHRIGAGSDIHSFREYVRGDSLRHVAWKKSASVGRWIMKQTEEDAARSVHVVVDPFCPRGVPDEAFEQLISEATTYVHDAVTKQSLDVVLTLPRLTVHAKEGEAAPLFRALALVEATHEPLDIPYDRGTVVFSLRRTHDAKTA